MTKQLTPQEWFDKTVNHLRSMSEQAKNVAGTCQYLTANGSKCAVGVHIPDGHPGQTFSGSTRSLIERYPDLGPVVLPTGDEDAGIALAHACQNVHDNHDHWGHRGSDDGFQGDEALAEIAKDFDLDFS